ncbi:MAG: hypothetical protein A4E52_01069 [Pelotomaculum sp. PtaB.Bin013]|uniref:Uncharacterized protein n=1 Tax=Pelotomaculum isophthalicicum JI TaxID=947010 RepID=A0A9X4GZJ5_9FIRM|nr:hypothetical protein [Pelotomaculum isophthalicicum]MDF9408870.1 hypothetical protein [Pelotomaculum isophthalicicum JI]OPX89238.1 MAG: hypothetical protein A4E52_01069 [Pelotomaculum sp. PtaB.Bin013]
MHQEQDKEMVSKYDPEVIKQLKKEIIEDLEERREWREKHYHDGYGRGNYPPVHQNRKRRNYEDDWWTDREEYDYQRNMSLARNQLRDELRALDKMNQRLGQVRDPQIHQMLHDLLYEAREQGMGVQDLLQSLGTNNSGPGRARPFWNRITNPLRGIDRRSFGWGAGAALVGLLFLPSVSKSIRPLICKAMEEAIEINERVHGVFAQAKEEIEDIVAEVSFNKIASSPKVPVSNDDVTGKNEPAHDNEQTQDNEANLE